MAEKVLLVNPNRMKPAIAPIALDYLAHALHEWKFQVDLLDLCFSEDFARDIEEYFSRSEVVAVGVTLRNTDDTSFATKDFLLPQIREITDCLRAHTSAPLILGGSGFSVMPEAILDYCGLDLGIWGEGEHSLPLLISRIVANDDFSDVPALVYRTEEGIKRNPAHYLDLSQLSAPRRDTVDNRRYFVEGGMGNIESNRGCPKRCIYCADPLGKGRRLRMRSPQSVAEEIAALLEMGIDHLHFCGSEFNLPEHHAREVCLEMTERGLGDRVRWYAYLDPVPFSDELAGLFIRAGCAGINFGVDSGSNRMLRTLGRDFTVDDLERTAEICHRHGIIFMYDLLLGGPGETRESLEETIETMKRLSPSRVGAQLGVRIFPGTELAELVKRQGLRGNPNLYGVVEGNENFFFPVFYLSSELGPDAPGYLSELISGDERFFLSSGEASDTSDYNYNQNSVLVDAIKAGYRGAYWDILRRLGEGG